MSLLVSQRRFLPAAAASLLVLWVVVAAQRPLGGVPRGIALGAAAAGWLTAFARRRAAVTVVLAIAAAIAAGQTSLGPLYGVFAALVLLAGLVAMRAERGADSAPLDRRSSFVLAAAAGTVAGAMLLGLPPLAAVVERAVVARLGLDADEATAFSTTMALGATRGMLQSDAIVLRIEGERPDYLRGAVYDRYDGRYWVMSGGARAKSTVPADADPNRATTRIELVRGTPSGDDMRWFLPAGACDLTLPDRAVQVDRFGVVQRGAEPDPPTIALRTVKSGCARPPPEVAPPTLIDLDVYPSLARAITPIAAEWTREVKDANDARAKLDAIARRLEGFEYSLSVPRDPGVDPIVDFLTIHRAGHCEMFASATVLLARTVGVPARVVGGFRVTEVNPFTGRAVVRDRDAHAWVEAWVDGAWRAWDPTPAAEPSSRRGRGLAASLGDLLAGWRDRAAIAVARLETRDILLGLLVTILLLTLLRTLALRLAERRARRSRSRDEAPPHPSFEALARGLARRGIERAPSEPLEAFAARIEADAASAASAIRRYAALRYGGLGDEADVARGLSSALASLENREERRAALRRGPVRDRLLAECGVLGLVDPEARSEEQLRRGVHLARIARHHRRDRARVRLLAERVDEPERARLRRRIEGGFEQGAPEGRGRQPRAQHRQRDRREAQAERDLVQPDPSSFPAGHDADVRGLGEDAATRDRVPVDPGHDRRVVLVESADEVLEGAEEGRHPLDVEARDLLQMKAGGERVPFPAEEERLAPRRLDLRARAEHHRGRERVFPGAGKDEVLHRALR